MDNQKKEKKGMQGGAGRRTSLSARRARRTKSRGYSRPRQTMADQSILKSAVLPASPMPLLPTTPTYIRPSIKPGACSTVWIRENNNNNNNNNNNRVPQSATPLLLPTTQTYIRPSIKPGLQ